MTDILNIGAGMAENPQLVGYDDEIVFTRLDGNADTNPDIVHDIRQPFPEELHEKFDGVYMSHILEHVSWRESLVALENVMAVVKPGGRILIIVPNMEWACDQILRGNFDFAVLGVLYGGQATDWDYHRCGYTRESIVMACQRVDLTVRSVVVETYKVIMWGTDEYTAKEIRVVAEKPA